MNLNKLSFWLCWTVICLGLGYAWASGAYLKRINAQESLIKWYQENSLPEVYHQKVPADKWVKSYVMPKNW